MADEKNTENEIKNEAVNNGGNNTQPESNSGNKVIDEQKYNYSVPKPKGPAAIGKGGDPFFKKIYAPKEQIQELLDETITVQDWMQRETCNNVALACLDNENLKEIYFKIKDGFGEYGPMVLMGFKTPQGVEIPRLKILDTNGEVIKVLSGPLVIDEINKRVLAYKSANNFEEETDEAVAVEDYSGNPEGYT
ncbi:MAG: hypothetical protein MJ237_09130 [bacterium]|nr:hypothetical protein [bacterium]